MRLLVLMIAVFMVLITALFRCDPDARKTHSLLSFVVFVLGLVGTASSLSVLVLPETGLADSFLGVECAVPSVLGALFPAPDLFRAGFGDSSF